MFYHDKPGFNGPRYPPNFCLKTDTVLSNFLNFAFRSEHHPKNKAQKLRKLLACHLQHYLQFNFDGYLSN